MKKLLGAITLASLLLVGCGGSNASEDKVIKVGATPSPHAEILNAAKAELEKEGYTLEVTEFTDYIQPNNALNDGVLDANFFQHLPYLEDFNKENKTEISSIGAIHFEPLGIYANGNAGAKTTLSVDDVKDGAVIAVPNDTTNEARALQLLAAQGIIEVDESKGLEATILDITSNPKNITIKEVAAEALPNLLPDVDYAVINGNYALSGGVEKDVILTEDKGSDGAQKFANIVAVQTKDKDSEKSKALLKALQSDAVKEFIEKEYNGLVIPIF